MSGQGKQLTPGHAQRIELLGKPSNVIWSAVATIPAGARVAHPLPGRGRRLVQRRNHWLAGTPRKLRSPAQKR
jgi:hypothetical protein